MLNIKLEAPWYTWRKKAAALFEGDPDIIVGEVYEIDDDDIAYSVSIEVRNHEKFIALDRVLPSVKEFGNVKMAITLFDEENSAVNPDAALYETIFKGNPIFDRIEDTVDHTGTHISYCVFKPVISQFRKLVWSCTGYRRRCFRQRFQRRLFLHCRSQRSRKSR